MSEPFLAEIRIVSFGFAPRGYAQCNGQLLPINQNQAIFSLLGTTYGGNGQTNFALPDLRGRVPVEAGQNVLLGQSSGKENHTLLTSELPGHTHAMMGSSNQATTMSPRGNVLSEKARRGKNIYGPTPSGPQTQALDPQAVGVAGGSQPHTNMQPSLVLNFVIALQGIFPPRN